MSEFVASNGVSISRQPPVTDRGSWLMIDGHMTSPNDVRALREFFQHERDEELGRWRWPKNPDYVVYPAAVKSRVCVLRETGMGDLEWVDRGDERSYVFCHAARAYFDAHPERKPWHDAVEGDVWLLTINGEEEALLFRHDWTFISRDGDEFAPEESYITAGRRIWPEDAS